MSFHTFAGVDGVDFRVLGGDKLRFRLELDGALISTEQIYLGAMGKHPESNPFTLKR